MTPKPAANKQFVNSPSTTAQQSAASYVAPNDLAEGLAKQVFSSEEQVLEVLVSQVVSRYEDDPGEQAEMKEFLHTILETDPDLRSQILSGATIRR
jgi:hypothetical protein